MNIEKETLIKLYIEDKMTSRQIANIYNVSKSAILRKIKKFKDYPDIRFDINNEITLCENCHRKTYGKEESFEDFFTEIINNKNEYAS